MSNDQLPFVSIVFPNFNSGTFLVSTIDSILQQRYPVDRFEIIMVDNGSTDGSLEQVKHRFADVINKGRLRIFELGENRGCPAAYNYGITQMSPEARYLLRIDDDVALDPNCLEELVRCAEEDPSVGMVGGKVRYFADRKRIHLIGSRISPWFGACLGIGKAVRDRGQYDQPMDVQAVNGCLMLVRRSAIDRIGPMEEQYFLYFEDIDWALRTSRCGFRHRYVPQAIAYHDTATPRQRFRSTRWAYFNPLNTCYLAKRNFTKSGQLICWVVLSLKMLAYFPFVVIHNRAGREVVLRAMWRGYYRGTRLLFVRNGLNDGPGDLQGVINGEPPHGCEASTTRPVYLL